MTLTEPNTETVAPSRTFTQWVGAILRAAGERLDPSTIAVPSVHEVVAQRLRAVDESLLVAEAEEERARHTVAMLRERRERLATYDTRYPPAPLSAGPRS